MERKRNEMRGREKEEKEEKDKSHTGFGYSPDWLLMLQHVDFSCSLPSDVTSNSEREEGGREYRMSEGWCVIYPFPSFETNEQMPTTHSLPIQPVLDVSGDQMKRGESVVSLN